MEIKYVEYSHCDLQDFFFSSRRRHTRLTCDWSSDVCSSDLAAELRQIAKAHDAILGKAGEERRDVPRQDRTRKIVPQPERAPDRVSPAQGIAVPLGR